MKGCNVLDNKNIKSISNIAFLGHAGSGKSTLCDAVIAAAGDIEKIGSNANATLTMDFDPEEKKRKISINTAVYPVIFKDKKINLIDVPGLFDFSLGTDESLLAADAVVLTLSGKSGFTVGAEKAAEKAIKNKKPLAVFISKLNSKSAQFYRAISILTGKYGSKICPVFVPVVENEETVCYADLINEKYCTFNGLEEKPAQIKNDKNVENMRSIMLEAIASAKEDLMEKYFSGEAFTKQEKLDALKQGFVSGDMIPVFCGVGETGAGVMPFIDTLINILPNENEISLKAALNGKEITIDENYNDTAAVCFKTVADAFVGKLSYLKVIKGTLKPDTKLKNSRTGEEIKLSKLLFVKGANQIETTEVLQNDICAVAKIANLKTGDTLSLSGAEIVFEPFEKPNFSVAVYAKKKGEEEKISLGLKRLCEEDPTISFKVDEGTKESILSGLGEQHIDVIISKLKNKFGVEVELKKPKIAYRETIKKFCKVQGRYKKQSGGHGQFGDVFIEFSPCTEDFVFEEKIFGGAVPKNFFPAVEKGLKECMQKGVLAGYPMVGVKAVLVDGSYHPVDSSEMSFKMAAAEAFKAGIPNASPCILEPVGTLKALVPDDNLGDVIGDINKRRGRVIGMEPKENRFQELVAEVPVSEMGDFATAMRSITQGRGSFELNFERYEEAPLNIAQKIIAENQ